MSEASRLRRDPRRAVLGGVCAGFARWLGIDPIITRVAMVVLTIGSGGGAVIGYLIGWALIPAETQEPALRRGRRGRTGSWRIAAGIALLVVSVLLVFRQLEVWWSDAVIWPVALAAFGVALLWTLSRQQAEQEEEESEGEANASVRASAARSMPAALRLEAPAERGARAKRASAFGFGIALVVGAALLFLWAVGALSAASDVALAAIVVVVAIGLISAPFWWSMARRLSAERTARVRSQERAEVAAHLHDSVLQTLALMQKRAGDRDEVAKLARRQERELRSWLAGGEAPRPAERLADALRAAAEDVEEAHGAPVDAIVVGDAPLDDRTVALVAAAREALTNAAKFASEAGPVHLYAEIENGSARVFIDDRGPGFDPDAIPDDRRGVRESIIGRMKRHGGRVEIRSAPGEGTEVELSLERNGR
ncbi:MAG TPA: PspC domain-containing protein [Solirubrobacterales bacterium]|nr:PspC domain-containing protein [Solirubrobacterales bacterium]